MPDVIQLTIWDRLNIATNNSVGAELVLGIAHGEEIELWATRIRGVMVECKEMLLVELQQQSGLNLVDLWLGLLLGDTGCLLRRRLSCGVEFSVDFYDRAGIWIVEYRANV